MADWTWQTREIRIREYVLPSPTNGAQVRQVLGKMDDELGADKSRWDDAICVTARDDEIVFSYEISNRLTRE